MLSIRINARESSSPHLRKSWGSVRITHKAMILVYRPIFGEIVSHLVSVKISAITFYINTPKLQSTYQRSCEVH